MVDGMAGKELEGGSGDKEVVADDKKGRIGIEAWDDGVSKGCHQTCEREE